MLNRDLGFISKTALPTTAVLLIDRQFLSVQRNAHKTLFRLREVKVDDELVAQIRFVCDKLFHGIDSMPSRVGWVVFRVSARAPAEGGG